MTRLRRAWRISAAMFTLAASAAFAIDTTVLPTDELQTRYKALTHELRCMQCQNQSIADSPVGLATDLREQVKEQLIAGKSDTEIRDYMVARYGNYILFTPPFEKSTAWVWVAPALGLVGGLIVAVRIVRSRKRLVDDDGTNAGEEEGGR
jgi:cytochrome c-type biogenesis protein CcmH